MENTRRSVLTATCISHGWIHVCELSVPALLLTIQAEFGVGDLEMGRTVAIYALLFGIGSLPAGLLVDRFGSRLMLLVCMFGAGLSLAAMALSPDLTAFSIAAAGMGLSLSIYHPAGTAWISHALPHSGRVFAWHGMAGNTGVASASIIAGGLGWWLGWRLALATLAVISIIIGLRLMMIGAGRSPRTSMGSSRQMNRFAFVMLLVSIGFMGMIYRGMTTFLPKLFAGRLSEGVEQGVLIGGIWTSVALFTGLAGMYVAGWLSDRGHHPATVFMIGAALQVPFLMLIPKVDGMLTVPLVMGVAFFHFFTQPVGNQLVARLTPPEMRGAAYGIYFLLGFGLGSGGAYLGGWVSEQYGLPFVFTALAVLAIPAVLAIIPLRRLKQV